MSEFLTNVEVPTVGTTSHGESTSYFEPVAAYSSSYVCCGVADSESTSE